MYFLYFLYIFKGFGINRITKYNNLKSKKIIKLVGVVNT